MSFASGSKRNASGKNAPTEVEAFHFVTVTLTQA